MNAVIWKLLDLGFDLLAFGMKREEIVAEARAKLEAGATPDEVAQWLHDMRKQKAAETRQEVNDWPDDV